MLDKHNGAQLDILLVENNPERFRQVKDTLVEAGIQGRLHRVGDVSEALAYLRQDVPYFAAPTPNSVIIGGVISVGSCCDLAHETRCNPRLRDTRLIDLCYETDDCDSHPSAICCDIACVTLPELIASVIGVPSVAT